jgi:protein O-GlcNAc transferase
MTSSDKLLAEGLAALNQRNWRDAERLFRGVLQAQPTHVGALNLLTAALMNMERFAEAEPFIAEAVRLNPLSDASFYNYGIVLKRLEKPLLALTQFDNAIRLNPKIAETWNNRGTVLNDLKRYGDAIADFDKGISLNQNYHDAFYNKGKSLTELKRHDEALTAYDKALALKPDLAEAWLGRGHIFTELKRYDDAFVAYDRALELRPGLAEAWLGRGNVFTMLGHYDKAFAAYDRAIELKPDLAEALLGRGNVFTGLNRYNEALSAYDRALALKPDLAGAWLGRGTVFNKLKRDEQAFTAYDRALALESDLAEAWLGRGNVFAELRRHDEAFATYERALALKPDLAEAWLGRGNVLAELKRHNEAFAAYDRAVALKPDLAEAWLGRGNVFTEFSRYKDAVAAYDKALTLNPTLKYAVGNRLFAKLQMCDWTDLEAEVAQLLSMIREQKPSSRPFLTLAITASATDQLQCAKRFIQDQPIFAPHWHGELYSHNRIRVAYLSADFCDHPVGHLAVGLFEYHNKSRFEIMAISFGSEENSTIRRRIEGASEHFIDVRHQSDQDVAELICQLEIDILVDLMGLTRGNRLDVLARRPAPIQVSYLGYLGSSGANFIDYLIGDEIAVPSDEQKHYTETIVHLPDCFLVNDNQLQIASHTPSRLDLGLPARGFVFCSFNNSYKFGRAVFESWMRLLHAVEGSVLWLLESNPEMVINLRCEAQRCGISHDRIVFAPRVELSSHLARQRSADLFLDTAPYNAGATAAAALWSGVPILTMMGETFVGRMAASTLHAVGLPQLVTSSLPDYEALALKIATEPAFCSSLKQTLARNRDTFPLFNTERSTRNIEAAYTTMWERYQRGETPRTKWQS